MEDRIITPEPFEEDISVEATIRPASLDEFVGQSKIKENLKIFIEAAKKRTEPLDHVLLSGPPGLGKTTLSQIIAREMAGDIKITSGPAIDHPGSLAAILTNLNRGDILFIDEIHRLNPLVEEKLYPAMEDFQFDIVTGKGPEARIIKLGLPKFTLVGATTRVGMLTSPLRDRFGVVHRMEFYDHAELKTIIDRTARILGIKITADGAVEIAKRSRGTPRIANRLVRRVRDYAQVRANGVIDKGVADAALQMLEVDHRGLDAMDRRLLETIIGKFGGGPVGVETVAAAINEQKDTVEDVYEPYLMQEGFLARTPRGRVATQNAYDHLNIKDRRAPSNGGTDQPKLF